MSLRLLTILPLLSLAASFHSAAFAQVPDMAAWCIPGAAINVFVNGS